MVTINNIKQNVRVSMTHKLIFEKNVISEDNFGFRISRLYYKNYKNQF